MPDLHVHQWRHELALPSDWDAGRRQAAASELQAMTQEIAGLLADALDGSLQEHEVVLLPALCVDARFDLRADRHAACAQWARELALQLLHALHDPGAGAVRFASHAHHAAAYLLARTRGGGSGSWWWRSFEGLAVLPLAQAVRTLLERAPDEGMAILRALDDAEAPAVLGVLGEAEAWHVLLTWCEQLEAGGDTSDIASAPALVTELLRAARGVHAPASAALLALRGLSRAKDGSLPSAADIVRAAGAAVLLRAGAEGGASALRDPLDVREAAARALLRRLDGPARQALARAVHEATHAEVPAHSDDSQEEALATPFGGAAWLLYAIHELLADSARWPWPAGGPAAGSGLLGLLTLAAAMPPSLALAAWRDRAWRRVLGVPESLDLAATGAALRDAAAAAGVAEAAWSRWLERTARDACELRLPAEDDRGAAACPVDRASGLWLTPELAAQLPASGPLSFRERLALTRATRGEARFLAANEVTQSLPAPWAQLVQRLAHGALRRLALRIPGMAWASAAHLHANVLGVRGVLRPGVAVGADWLLQLERAPLDVLLAMTGLVRARWPVQPDRWLVLARADAGEA
jgi:hypothetical protein